APRKSTSPPPPVRPAGSPPCPETHPLPVPGAPGAPNVPGPPPEQVAVLGESPPVADLAAVALLPPSPASVVLAPPGPAPPPPPRAQPRGGGPGAPGPRAAGAAAAGPKKNPAGAGTGQRIRPPSVEAPRHGGRAGA